MGNLCKTWSCSNSHLFVALSKRNRSHLPTSARFSWRGGLGSKSSLGWRCELQIDLYQILRDPFVARHGPSVCIQSATWSLVAMRLRQVLWVSPVWNSIPTFFCMRRTTVLTNTKGVALLGEVEAGPFARCPAQQACFVRLLHTDKTPHAVMLPNQS